MSDALTPSSALAGYVVAASTVQQAGVVLRARHPLHLLDLRVARTCSTLADIGRTLSCELPPAGASSTTSEGDILRIGPQQWLLVATPASRWREHVHLPGATLCDVSHGRVCVRVSGPDARAALAKGCMLDLHPRAFRPGACTQTVVAKMNIVVHRLARDEATFDLYASRSYAGSFWHWLTESAQEFGCRVER